MRPSRFFTMMMVLVPGVVFAEPFKIEILKQGPPASISPEIAGALHSQGYRISDSQGKTFAELWLRKSIPATAKPLGPKGTIQFPFLAESELLGVVHFVEEGHDYRDQTIAKGIYTMRYGLLPVNGDHLGVSPYRDYSLLLPAAKDRSPATLPRKQLETQSAESAGSSHPAVLLLVIPPPAGPQSVPRMIHHVEKNTWQVVVPLNLAVKGETHPVTYPVSIIVVGTAES
jgi:hypothetical protein